MAKKHDINLDFVRAVAALALGNSGILKGKRATTYHLGGGHRQRQLAAYGAEVVNDSVTAVHVSGHASQEEIKLMHNLVRPKFFIPVHGEYRHLIKHAKLAQELGMPKENIFISENGQVLEFTRDTGAVAGKVTAGRVLVDGLGVGDVGNIVLRDRRQLSQDGILIIVLTMNKETGEVRSGQVDAPAGFDYYLIKLDGVSAKAGFRETENYGRLEYSFYRLARACHIEMTECSLLEENGRAHFLTRRFDREGGRKIHMQTLCGLAHYDFRLHRAYSYEQAFNVMRALRLSYAEAQEMFRRLVFNVVVRNQDDHTKNISFLMNEDGRWRLSPAYDLGYAYNPVGGWTATHQMSVNGKYDGITREDLLALASANHIKDASAEIERISEEASRWPDIARDCDVPEEMIRAVSSNMVQL